MAKRTAVLLTVFNRKEVTLKGLRSLYKAIVLLPEDEHEFDIYMTDDGCTDGTGNAVRQEFPEVHIIQGDGNLYWSGGMRAAWQAAIDSKVKYDYYLWFNDDVDLFEDSLCTLYNESERQDECAIIVGAMHSEDASKVVTYSGRDGNKKLMEPEGKVGKPCVTFNGNLVLIPSSAYKKLGMLDSIYSHSLADFDYGYRASEIGVRNIVAPKYTGSCDRHSSFPTWCNPDKPLSKRIKHYYSPMGNPPREVFTFERRHYGLSAAIIHLATNHIRLLFPSLWKNSMI